MITARNKDVKIAALIGGITGTIATILAYKLQIIPPTYDGQLWFGPGAVAAIFVFGIYLGRFLGQHWAFFDSFARFVIVGFFSSAIDFGILNILIFSTDITKGFYFSVFRVIAVAVAFINSYLLNKHWSFRAGKSAGGKREFLRFAIVVLIGVSINVGIASLIVNLIPPMFGFDAKLWANIATMAGIAVGLFWNFLGMRLIVFKTKAAPILAPAIES